MTERVLDVYRQEESFGAAEDLQHALELLAAARAANNRGEALLGRRFATAVHSRPFRAAAEVELAVSGALQGNYSWARARLGTLAEQLRLDGAGEFRICFGFVMPNVKPAWMTLMIFSFQAVWNSSNNTYIYKEQLKTLPTVMSQLAAGGVARVGVGAASSVILMLPPVLLFVFTQTNIIDTMATSGMKD